MKPTALAGLVLGAALLPNSAISAMQGFVLKEFLKYASHRFGPRQVERVLEKVTLQSNCQFACWKYVDPVELTELLEGMVRQTGLERRDILVGFGRQMFQTLINMPLMQPVGDNLFDFMESVEPGFYQELLDLFPDLELPRLTCTRIGSQTMQVDYDSPRRLGDLAEGLILAAIAHFPEEIALRRLDDQPEPGVIRFVLERDNGEAE